MLIKFQIGLKIYKSELEFVEKYYFMDYIYIKEKHLLTNNT